MDLFKEIEDEEAIEEIRVQLNIWKSVNRPIIRKVELNNLMNGEITPLAQFFLVPFELDQEDSVLHIPVYDNETKEQVFREIAPHFEECKIVEYENYTQIMLNKVNPKSKNLLYDLITKKMINPFVYSVYGNKCVNTDYGETKDYNVNLEIVQKSSEQSFLKYGISLIVPL